MEEKLYILYHGNTLYVEVSTDPSVEEDEPILYPTAHNLEALKKLVGEKIAKTDAKYLSVFCLRKFFRRVFLDNFPQYVTPSSPFG